MRQRTIRFHGELKKLIDDQTKRGVFRVDHNTVGITDGLLCKTIMAARPLHDFERTVFKPVDQEAIPSAYSSAVMRAVAQDIRYAIKSSRFHEFPMTGTWPNAGHQYLRNLLFPSDPCSVRLLSKRILDRSETLIRLADKLALWNYVPDRDHTGSALLSLICQTDCRHLRRRMLVLYRRAASAVCTTISTLVTHALWYASPLNITADANSILLETLRLLPPAWMFLRKADQCYASLHAEISASDDLLLIPFLAHRNPSAWPYPDEFRPERWKLIDVPEDLPDYFPFGHASDRCWARQLVLSLSANIIEEMAARRLSASPRQSVVRIPMAPLLSIARLRVVAQ